MGISDILAGHVNEALGLNKNISESRMAVCKKCLLYKSTLAGPICNNKLWYDPETGDISMEYKSGYINGCGCRLLAKTTLPSAVCPINKW